MSNSITVPASMQPPVPPPNALNETLGADPTESVVHYQLSSGQIASLPQSSVPALLQQDKGAKQIPSPADGEVLVQLSSGHAATLPASSVPALKQQDPNVKYIAGDSTAQKQLTPGFDALSAVAGPTTAVGAPASPEMRAEGSGVSDILHGNFREGAGKIWDAEKPHVIQGSLLEKAMQKIDPTFQGGVTKDQVEAHNAAEPIAQPAVDVAQFIDKDKHPVAKALAETAQNVTSPQNLAILYGSGGAGLVDNPVSLGIAKRLLAGGFSAAAVASAYKNYKGFQAAVDSGDDVEAHYQLTHAITSGALGVLAGSYAAEPVVTRLVNPFRSSTPSVSGAPSTAEPSVFQKTVQGEKSVQPQAQSALRGAAESVNGQTSPVSLRTALDGPADTMYATAKNLYRRIDQAAGTDFKALNEKLDNTEYQIRQLTETEDDVAKEAALEKARTATMDKIAAAKQQALDNGVDPSTLDQADAQLARARALQEVQTKVFKNPNIVSGNTALGREETVNVDAAVKALQRLQDNTKWGASRLEQALGKDAADGLLKNLYDAQTAGEKAIKYNAVFKGLGKWLGRGVIGALGYETLKTLSE